VLQQRLTTTIAKQKLHHKIEKIVEQEATLAKISGTNSEIEKQSPTALSTEILTILFSIQNAITDMQVSLKRSNSETIESIVKAMQTAQPQMSPEAAMQAQLVSALIQNPGSLKNLMELSQQFPSKPK